MGEKEVGEEKKKDDSEELSKVLNVVSIQVPSLIRGIIQSVFSEEAGRDMGKAAGAFYKGLKEAGLPEESCVKMTENYVGTFTSLGDMMRKAVEQGQASKNIGEDIAKKVKEAPAREQEVEEKE